jgi:single-stranded DNA-binding protein
MDAQAANAVASLILDGSSPSEGPDRSPSWETPEGDKRSVTEFDADEVGGPPSSGPPPRWNAVPQGGNGDRAQARERQAERGSDFNDPSPL